jgi:DNA adenine methylase
MLYAWIQSPQGLKEIAMQRLLFDQDHSRRVEPFKPQLLKWVGNKQRFAHEIASHFPTRMGTYFEPFLGGGGVLGTLAPASAIASDVFRPLMEIWQTLHDDPAKLKRWYEERWQTFTHGDKGEVYAQIRASYNARPNGADLVFLCRACYGGVVRFRQADGYMSTPCGIHRPIPPTAFSRRVDAWHRRTRGARFLVMDYEEAMDMAKPGDLVYCDPPYTHSQSILYGAQSFALTQLFQVIARCKSRGVFVALSIDGTKKSGTLVCDVPVPEGLFPRELLVNCGRSMLRRFQMEGRSLETEMVADRLLLTY